MKAAVTHGRGDIAISEAPMPEHGEYRCLCRVLACATCSGTDVKIIDRKLSFEVPYPGIFGHESVGEVIKTGSRARYIRPGDIFLRPTAVYPEEKLGEYFSSWGGFAEYGLVTDIRAFREDNPEGEPAPYAKFQQKIPGGIKPGDASMLITLKEAASFIANAGINLYSSVLILGAGPVAKAMCFFSKLNGAQPVALAARRKEPLEWAAEAGADFTADTGRLGDVAEKVKKLTSGKGADFLIDTTGSPELVISLMDSLSARGKAVPYATYPEADSFGRADSARFLFSGPSEHLANEYMIYLLQKKFLEPGMFYDRVMPFIRIREGFELLRQRKAKKIVFTMEAGG